MFIQPTVYTTNGYKQDNGDNKKWWIIAMILVGFILFLCSCNPAKQLDKAKQKVITDSAAFDYVGRKFVALNPCANTVIYKSDTTITHDTTESFFHYTDTIKHTDTIKQVQKIHDKYLIHDTLKVVDNQQVKLFQEQLTQRNLQIAQMNGQLIQANNAVKEAQSNTNKWKFYFWALVTLLGLGTIWKVYTSLKPKI